MLLKSIEYYNFRPFMGEQVVNLDANPAKPDANVTVILGNNTHGKSTFVLSFIWCFYGESRFNKSEDILNKNIEEGMRPGDKEKAYVKVEFEDNGTVYTIKRTQRFKMGNNGVLMAEDSFAEMTYIEDNQPKSVGRLQNEIQLAMKTILPKDLSSFFFFEGEKDNEISKRDLSGAVQTLIGLEAYDNMRKHLHGSQNQSAPTNASVMGYYLGKQGEKSGSDASKAYEEKTQAENECEKVKQRLEEIAEEIKKYENERERTNQILREAAPSKEIQKRRDQIAREIASLEEKEKKKNKAFLKKFSEDSIPLFLTPLFGKTTDRLVELDVNDKGIKGIEAVAIRELLHRGECLCGTDLKEGTLPYKNVEKFIEYVPPRSIGILVRDMQEKIDGYTGKNQSFVSTMEELHAEIIECRTKIDTLEKEDKSCLQQIQEIGEVDTEQAEESLRVCKSRLKSLREEQERKSTELGTLKNKIDTATKQFNSLKQKNKEARQYQVLYAYAEAIYNWVQQNYGKKEAAVREKLNTHIKELFNNMYAGERDIEVDEKYNIRLTVNGQDVDITGGLRVIKYFSYVGAIVQTAYEIMQERETDEEGNQELLGEQYPLVLDAAFSHADDVHTKNIAKELSKAASQLVFAVMKKDWEYAKEGIGEKVARIYELQKISETEVKIVEVK